MVTYNSTTTGEIAILTTGMNSGHLIYQYTGFLALWDAANGDFKNNKMGSLE